MTEEIEAGGAGPQIENADDFAKWLAEVRPAPDVCVALAARAALRALPLITQIKTLNSITKTHIIPSVASCVFRAAAISLLSAKYSRLNHYKYLSNSAINSALKLATSAEYSSYNLLWSAFNAANASTIIYSRSENHGLLDQSFTLDRTSLSGDEPQESEIFNFTNRAIGDAVMDFSSDSQIFEFWVELEKDMSILSLGGSVKKITDRPLWDILPPNFISNYWITLADALPDTNNWQVWKNWYEDILNGKIHSKAHDMIYATVPVEEWDKGPAAANAWIAARLAELNELPPEHLVESFEKLIQQDPHGASFEIVEGKARIAATLDENDSKVAEDPQTIQLHERVKIRANNAREIVRRLANQPGFESIAETVEEFYTYISGDTLSVAANISTVWELSVAIGSFIERDDEIRAGRGGMVSEMEPDARETLDQLVITSAPFVRRFPTARQNDDDVRLFKQSRTNFDSARRVFEQAANENLIEDKSNLTINIAITAAETSSGIQSEKSVSWINSTARNFAGKLIAVVFGVGIACIAIPGKSFLDKLGNDIYDKSNSSKDILNFILKLDNDFHNIYSDAPADLKAAHKEIMQELKKSQQSQKHHRK